jgi:hypothetical protein
VSNIKTVKKALDRITGTPRNEASVQEYRSFPDSGVVEFMVRDGDRSTIMEGVRLSRASFRVRALSGAAIKNLG